jgi:hypothetical protein
MAWNAIDDFNATSDTQLTDWGGGSNWTASQNWGVALKGGTSSDFIIDTTQLREGARSLHVKCTSAQAYIQRNVDSAQTTALIYFSFRAAQTDKLCYVYFTLSGGSGRGMFEIKNDGNINVMGGTLRRAVGAYSANTWYYAAVEWGGSGIRAKIGTTSWGSWSDYDGIDASAIRGFQFEQDAANGAEFWFDNISITDPLAAVGPANLKTYNTNVAANIKTINTNPIANVKSLDTNV